MCTMSISILILFHYCPNSVLLVFLFHPLIVLIPFCPLRMRLEAEADELTQSGATDSERLQDVYERLEELDAATAETKAARILYGLGKP